MKNLLNIRSSLNAEQSQSNQLTDHLLSTLNAQGEYLITTRDLAAEPVPHLDGERFAAFLTDPNERSGAQQAVVDESDALINELQQADLIVLGLPMYNFGIPSTLKAWIDHVARAGITFRYTENGPEGLLTGKKVVVVAARGGLYAGTEKDTQTTYIKNIFAFMGITDIEFVYAEGLAIAEHRDAALSNARQQIETDFGDLATQGA